MADAAAQVLAAAAAAAAAAQAGPIPFAMTPALVRDTVLDYRTKEGMSIFNAAKAPLHDEDFFGVEPLGLRLFLTRIDDRAATNGWDDAGILAIPTDPEHPDTLSYLVEEYGQISLEPTD